MLMGYLCFLSVFKATQGSGEAVEVGGRADRLVGAPLQEAGKG
jgi:hypothetical protein